ncbi:MAG: methyltransferase domain-containing protein [Negativicutes bacterium]|nr:methyltransferase domain-containing protein [Negativicutes bacterium]
MKNFFFKKVLEGVKKGGLKVTFWDGEEFEFGDASPEFHLIFRKEPKAMEIEDLRLALGEAYMDETIDFEGNLGAFLSIMEKNEESFCNMKTLKVAKKIDGLLNKAEQKGNIGRHYDLGNDFFSLWLDKTMTYSCAYFTNSDDTLEQAQRNKIEYILKKLNLRQGERLLDIGCGWGGIIINAAQEYGVNALGITLSEEQYVKTKERIEKLGLNDKVDVKLMNYLDLDKNSYQFDKIVSVGMFEHVGKENLHNYMKILNELLAPGGLSLLHTITCANETTASNTWMTKYIFPGSYVPSLREIMWQLPEYDFHPLHIESLRLHYAKTLDIWYKNFLAHIEDVRKKFDERFVRMWSLYLLCSAASFRATDLDVFQLLFSKGLNNGLPMTYGYLYKGHE